MNVEYVTDLKSVPFQDRQFDSGWSLALIHCKKITRKEDRRIIILSIY